MNCWKIDLNGNNYSKINLNFEKISDDVQVIQTDRYRLASI